MSKDKINALANVIIAYLREEGLNYDEMLPIIRIAKNKLEDKIIKDLPVVEHKEIKA